MSLSEGLSRALGNNIISGGGRPQKDYNHASDETYKRLRDEAREAQNSSQRYRSEAKHSYDRGDKAGASEFKAKADQAEQQANNLNTEAAQWVFRANNADSKPDEIDLHGLFVREALSALDARVHAGMSRGENHVNAIVGKGIHSENHIAKLKPAVEEYCQKQGLRWNMEKHNDGVIVIQLPQGQGNYQSQGQGNYQPQGQGNYQPQGQGNYQGYAPPQQGYGSQHNYGGQQNYQQNYQQQPQQQQQQQHHGFSQQDIRTGISVLRMLFKIFRGCCN